MTGKATITIDGKAVALKFAWNAVKDFSLAAEKKQHVYYDGGQLSFLGMAKLLHCGYKCACEVQEVEPEMTLEPFSDFVESSMSDPRAAKELTNALTVFAKSQTVKTLAELNKNSVQEEAKKKTVKAGTKKSRRSSSR